MEGEPTHHNKKMCLHSLCSRWFLGGVQLCKQFCVNIFSDNSLHHQLSGLLVPPTYLITNHRTNINMKLQAIALQPELCLDFEVKAYEVDANNRLTLVNIANYLYETAKQHADQLEVGVNDLLKQDLTWVFTRLKIDMYQYPKCYETIRVSVFFKEFDKNFIHRCFTIYNAQGRQIGEAVSACAIIDTNTRRMVEVPQAIKNIPTLQNEPLPPYARIPKVTQPLKEECFKVRWSDLDFNQHVNHAYYLQWVIESLPAEVLQHQQLASIDVMYRRETLWNDEIVARAQEMEAKPETNAPQAFKHQLIRQQDDTELAKAITVWV